MTALSRRPAARAVVLLLFCLNVAPAVAARTDDVAGRVVGRVDGRTVELPLLKADYDVRIAGDLATITLTQRFANPSSVPMTATYLFPLDTRAAVFAMEMRAGDEVVRAVIRERAEAEAAFAAAEREGKAAALLTQHRPNMFTQQIANLMPGRPVEVRLSIVQPVRRVDGALELVVPMIVGPRYEGAAPDTDALVSADDEASLPEARPDGWRIAAMPDHPPVAGIDLPPESVDPGRVSLDLALDAGGLAIAEAASPTHALDVEETGDGLRARLAEGRVIGNRDFVLRYRLGGADTAVGVLAHPIGAGEGGVISLMLTPPEVAADALATPRELVFVLDTSGSMNGAPLAASRRFMDAALAALRPDDAFRIVSFSNAAHHFAATALPATSANVAAGRAHVARLAAGGGTEIDRAIRSAFDTVPAPGRLRVVVFLSDGYIGDEATVLRTLRDRLGDARIHAFGIGTAVNRYLLEAMAEEGRGRLRVVDPTETASEAAERLARDLETPVLTDIEIDWGGLDVAEPAPRRLPDLFAGDGVRVLARYAGEGPHEIVVRGRVRGREAELPVRVALPGGSDTGEAATAALPLVWARERIAGLERAHAVRDGDPARIEAEITRLGLEHGLQTRYTSFVAVSERVVDDTGTRPERRAVADPMVAGVEETAYERALVAPAPAAAPGFTGGATPEPETLASLALLSLIGGLAAWRRRRAAAHRAIGTGSWTRPAAVSP
ncbi:MAG: VIT domain-containing protein [Paracoccaceae bacterium]